MSNHASTRYMTHGGKARRHYLIVHGVLDVDDVEHTRVTVTGGESPDTSSIATTRDHDGAANFEFENLGWSHGRQVNGDGISNLCVWVWVSEGFTIVEADEWDSLWSESAGNNFAELGLVWKKKI